MVLQKNKNELTIGPEGEEAVRQSSSEERSAGLEDPLEEVIMTEKKEWQDHTPKRSGAGLCAVAPEALTQWKWHC